MNLGLIGYLMCPNVDIINTKTIKIKTNLYENGDLVNFDTIAAGITPKINVERMAERNIKKKTSCITSYHP